jgi:AraC family transcriptional activator of mar-sox-rob regulon
MNVDPDFYEKITVDKGLYVQFFFRGLSADFQSFILKLYHTCLPSLGLIRREGLDIERYHTDQNRKNHELPVSITCDYMIPVRRHVSGV